MTKLPVPVTTCTLRARARLAKPVVSFDTTPDLKARNLSKSILARQSQSRAPPARAPLVEYEQCVATLSTECSRRSDRRRQAWVRVRPISFSIQDRLRETPPRSRRVLRPAPIRHIRDSS